MKKYFLLVTLTLIAFTASAQTQLPRKMTKGLEVEVDDFNEGIKYRTKSTGLSVLSKADECAFTWVLNCVDLVPVSFSKIQMVINGKVEEISFTQDIYNEYSETVLAPNFTVSRFGAATTLVNQNRYFAEIKLDASQYIELLEDIVKDKNDVKIKFSGKKEIVGVYNKKKKEEIKNILEVYNALKDN